MFRRGVWGVGLPCINHVVVYNGAKNDARPMQPLPHNKYKGVISSRRTRKGSSEETTFEAHTISTLLADRPRHQHQNTASRRELEIPAVDSRHRRPTHQAKRRVVLPLPSKGRLVELSASQEQLLVTGKSSGKKKSP